MKGVRTNQGYNFMQMSGISQQNNPQLNTQQLNNMNNNLLNTKMVDKFIRNSTDIPNPLNVNNNQFSYINQNNINQNNMNPNNFNNMNQNNMNNINPNNLNNMNQNNMNNNGNILNNPLGNNNMGMGINININNDIQNQSQFKQKPFLGSSPMGNNSMNKSKNNNNVGNPNPNIINNLNAMNNMNISNNPNIFNFGSNNNNENNNNNNDQNILNDICDTHTLKLNQYYEYKPSETTAHLNSLLKDMDAFGEIIKSKIEQEKIANHNKFISIQEALSYNNQNIINDINNNNPNKDYFVLGILKLALESEGCICEIEREDPQFNEEKEFYTAIQFIVNGMYKYKKYIFHFDFGEEKNKIMFDDLLVQSKFNFTLAKNLSTFFNVTIKDIVMANPRQGPYKISAIIKTSNFNELTENQLFNQLKKNPDYISLLKVEKTILLNGCKLNRAMLDCRGDRIQGWGENEMRGGKPYIPPLEWIGIGIRVLDRYDGGDNTWLDYQNEPGEWSVAYHGMGTSLSGITNYNSIQDINNLLNTAVRQQFKKENDKYHIGQTVGEGVYMTQFPKIMEKNCAVYNCNGKKYKIGIMCRVMPDKIRCPMNNDDYWVINGTDNEVRPYRFLIKEVN